MPRRRSAIAATTLAAAVAVVTATPAAAYPPDPPGESAARQHLAALTVAAEGSMAGYDREKFPHWSSRSGNCDTRESVLGRDGVNVTTGSDCYPDTGRWYSVYDQQWVEDPSDVHIDHVVALAEAWRSGADDWSTAKRENFANDMSTQQLIAVSGESNMSKSDEDPAQWLPDNNGYYCMYARSWINVKYSWNLTVNPAEQDALSSLLDTC